MARDWQFAYVPTPNIQGGYQTKYWLRLLPVWAKLILRHVFWPNGYHACMCAVYLLQPALIIVFTKFMLTLPAVESLGRVTSFAGLAYLLLGCLTIFRAFARLEIESRPKIARLFINLFAWFFWTVFLTAIFLPMNM